MRLKIVCTVLLLFRACSYAAENDIGWRGDSSGKFPDTDPPTTWGRVSKAVKGLRFLARKPANEEEAGKTMPDGVVREWLILGPVPIPDVPKAVEKDTLVNELQLSPDEGDKIDALAWKKIEADTATLDFTSLIGAHPKSFAYAHSYIFAETEGDYCLQLAHRNSVRVVFNGKQVYASQNAYGGRISLRMLKGWNRLLLKVSPDEAQWFLVPVVFSHSPRGYDENNIAWMTSLPGAKVYQANCAGSGAPIVVKDKIFLLCEPHSLFCLNKEDGKVLWVRPNSYFDALTDAEKAAEPRFKDVESLALKLNDTDAEYVAGHGVKTSRDAREKLEKDLYDAMRKIDAKRFSRPASQDVGYAGLTPASDGEYVYAWFASGVSACYDLDGNRKWIRIDNHETVEHGFSSSPIVSSGKMIVFMRDLMAFDTKTGTEVWRDPVVQATGMNPGSFFHGSFSRARIGDAETVIPANGTIVRVSDGKILFSDTRLTLNQTVSSPVVDKDILCIMTAMNATLYILRLPERAGEKAEPVFLKELKIPTSQFPVYYLDWHLASPIVHEGLIYLMNNSGVLTVVDEKEGSIVYQKLLDLDHFQTANEGAARGLGVSPVLAGGHIYFFGNSGAAVVLEPGRQFKQIAKNKIEGLAVAGSWGERQDRSVACPFVDGKRIYYRTESGLYAIGAR